MVAPLVLNRPTRVFARLTHTGENKTAEPVCCDLSRMASIMPANPLPKNLVFPHVVDNNTRATTPAPPPASKLLSPSYELCADKTTAGKRKREEGSGEDEQASTATTQSSSGAGEGTDAPPAKMVKLDSKSVGSEDHNGRTQGKGLTVTEASKLLAENEKLKIENEALKDKLMFLHMILQKEENYNSFVKTMKEYQRRRLM